MAYDNIGCFVGQKVQCTTEYEVVYACPETGMVILRCTSRCDGRRTLLHKMCTIEDFVERRLPPETA